MYDTNIADIKTLEPALEDWKNKFNKLPEKLAADRGYWTKEPCLELNSVKQVSIPTKGKKRHIDSDKPFFSKLQKLRNKIEPVIGHLKTDHRMDRSRYKGLDGDKINVNLGVLAWNCKKWTRKIKERCARLSLVKGDKMI